MHEKCETHVKSPFSLGDDAVNVPAIHMRVKISLACCEQGDIKNLAEVDRIL